MPRTRTIAIGRTVAGECERDGQPLSGSACSLPATSNYGTIRYDLDVDQIAPSAHLKEGRPNWPAFLPTGVGSLTRRTCGGSLLLLGHLWNPPVRHFLWMCDRLARSASRQHEDHYSQQNTEGQAAAHWQHASIADNRWLVASRETFSFGYQPLTTNHCLWQVRDFPAGAGAHGFEHGIRCVGDEMHGTVRIGPVGAANMPTPEVELVAVLIDITG